MKKKNLISFAAILTVWVAFAAWQGCQAPSSRPQSADDEKKLDSLVATEQADTVPTQVVVMKMAVSQGQRVAYKTTTKIVCDTIIIIDSSVVTPPDTSTYVRKNLLLDEGFESSNFLADGNTNKWRSEKCPPSTLASSGDISRSGTKSMKVVLGFKDACSAISSIRAEIKQPNFTTSTVERWYGVSYFFPTGYKKDPCPEILFQWHHNISTGSPPLALWSYGDKLKFNLYDIKNTDDNLVPVADITPGKWMDIVFHIKHTPNGDGFVQIWVNGLKVLDRQNIVTNYPGNGGLDYLKCGIYKWGWKSGYSTTTATTGRQFYMDDIRIGNEKATFNDVKPGK